MDAREAESFHPESSSCLRYQLTKMRMASLDNPADLWTQRLRVEEHRFQGGKHFYVYILNPDLVRIDLQLHVPPAVERNWKTRKKHAESQAGFQDNRYGVFQPGSRINPEAWGEYGASDEIVRQLREGFTLQVACYPGPYYKGNHNSFHKFGDAGYKLFDEVTANHWQEGPLLYRPSITHPQAIIEQPEKLRPVMDATASGLNKAQVPIPFTADTIHSVIVLIMLGDYLAKFDLKDAFRHWPMASNMADWLGVEGPDGNYYRQRFAAFGVAQSPAIQ